MGALAARDAVQSAASRDGPRLMGRPLTIRKLTTHDPDRSKAKRDPNRPALFAQLRRTRRLSDVEQILASVTLYTVKEFNMAMTALGLTAWSMKIAAAGEGRSAPAPAPLPPPKFGAPPRGGAPPAEGVEAPRRSGEP